MVAGIKSQLAANGVDVQQSITNGSLVLSSEQNHLVGDWQFDISSMIRSLERAFHQALKDGYQGLWATGDMTWEFGPAKDLSKLLEYEWRLEQFMREHPEMSGICQYHAETLPREILHKGLRSHSELFVSDTLTMINPHYVDRPSCSEPAPDDVIKIDRFITGLIDQDSLN